MVTFYLVRHGHSVANDKQIFAGTTDMPLSNIGKQQAQLVSDYIIDNLVIDKVYSSQLSRAYDTVLKVANKLNLTIEKIPEFNEIYGGLWEGLPFETILNDYSEEFLKWLTDIANSKCTMGESFNELKERAFKKLKELALACNGKRVLIATHAGTIRSLICAINNLTSKECNDLGWVSNASLTTVVFDNDKFKITSISYDDYLNDLKTSLPKTV